MTGAVCMYAPPSLTAAGADCQSFLGRPLFLNAKRQKGFNIRKEMDARRCSNRMSQNRGNQDRG